MCVPGSEGDVACGEKVCLKRNVDEQPDYVCVCTDSKTMGFDCSTIYNGRLTFVFSKKTKTKQKTKTKTKLLTAHKWQDEIIYCFFFLKSCFNYTLKITIIVIM